jgi:hypothetical protein
MARFPVVTQVGSKDTTASNSAVLLPPKIIVLYMRCFIVRDRRSHIRTSLLVYLRTRVALIAAPDTDITLKS